MAQLNDLLFDNNPQLDSISEDTQSSTISFACGTKNESSKLMPTIKKNNVEYNVGLLKVGYVYETTLQLIHDYSAEQYEINIPFKHTSNITVTDSNESENGHSIKLQLHPQKALMMKDYLDIQFLPKLKENEEPQSNQDQMEITNDGKVKEMKLQIVAKVLRKEQGTPFLKPGVTCLCKGPSYNTDLSATEWDK